MTVQIGLETLLLEDRHQLKAQRIGLIASPSSVDSRLESSVTRLYKQDGIDLVALFGPEHGIRGAAQAGQHVTAETDAITGLPVYSLYGETYKPHPDMLSGLDTLLYDLQDGGLRFYTYLSTLIHVMQAAGENGKRVVVLDRPVFLNGVTVEGNLLDPAFISFVGIHPLPIRYGMTAGEIARYCAAAFAIDCDFTVIPLRGWQRSMWFDETGLPFVPPSPNIPTLSTLTCYAGTCLIEGTNVSEGRGTTKPFEYIGAPYIDAYELAQTMNRLELPGVRFRPVYFVPTFSKYQGQLCAGVHVYPTNRALFQPVDTALHLIATIKSLHPEQFEWREPWAEGSHRPIDLLSGGDFLRRSFDNTEPVTTIIDQWKADSQRFNELRQPYLLY